MTWLAAVARFFPPKTWLLLGAIAAAVALGLTLYFAGRGDERDAQDVRTAKTEVRAGVGRETAATERHVDTTNITQRQQERDHAAEQTPDAVPDDREHRRRCRQLREHRILVPECRGSEG